MITRPWTVPVAAALFLLVQTTAQAPMTTAGVHDSAHPILFVTQVPIPADFTTIGSVFGNHLTSMQSVGRGGDLWIRYADGQLRNLTAAAGLGNDGFQGAGSIAVRDPAVHWDGTKAVFSMVVGAPTRQYQVTTQFWQLYEITGIGLGETPVVTRIPNQPATANISPIYGSDDRILFTSDRARDGSVHLRPQLDEYEEAPATTGIWSLDPNRGDLFLVVHAPSGDFTPSVDSYGRVMFTQWDHLQRDQQADADALGAGTYGTFDWSDQSPTAVPMPNRLEVFPEPRPSRVDLLAGTNLRGHRFNHFFPWTVREDGTGVETLDHLGRHELHDYFDKSIHGDPNVTEFFGVGRRNPNPLRNLLQIREDPLHPGTYYGTDAPEFATHAAGQIVRLRAGPAINGDDIIVEPVTHPDTANYTPSPGPDHTGLYREPLPLADNRVLAVHATATDRDVNTGTRARPASRYAFRLRYLTARSPYLTAGATLTGGISKSVHYWDPDVRVDYSGELWELNPVEVRPRARPRPVVDVLPAPELQAFANSQVDLAAFRAWLRGRDLAVLVTRNVTTRDRADRQQPFNLRVAGTATQTIGAPGTVYDVAHLQMFQADQLRSLGGPAAPRPGRRVLARTLHDPAATNPPSGGPPGSVAIADDGSVAAFVPARRAMSWQLTDPTGTAVVRERYWISFQPGEVRSCTSCHGPSRSDQTGTPPPTNVPQALEQLLEHWKSLPR